MSSASPDRLTIVSDIIHLAYSDISAPGIWAEAVRLLRRVIPMDGAFVTKFDPSTGGLNEIIGLQLEPYGVKEYEEYYHYVDFVSPRALESNVRVFRPEDIVPRKVYEASEYYNDFMLGFRNPAHPLVMMLGQGRKWYAHFALARDGSHSNFTREDVEFMSIIEPHISKAFLNRELQAGLRADCAALKAGLEQSAGALFLFCGSGCLVHANRKGVEVRDRFFETLGGLYPMVQKLATERLASAELQTGAQELEIIADGVVYQLATLVIREDDGAICCLARVNRLGGHDTVIMERLARNFGLSAREIEICGLLMRGVSNAEAAEKLRISEFTTKDHVKSIFRKLGIKSKNEILPIALAHEDNLL
ncbi:MAG TPA: helix-turn-helix transcriptional regulator [Armatimonadota bacterium]